MKFSDLLAIAFRRSMRKNAVLPAAAMAICVFCLGFSFSLLLSVEAEKALPYELAAAPKDAKKLTHESLGKLSAVKGVAATTALLEIPVSLQTGKSVAHLSILGMDASYFNAAFIKGNRFPADSAMPTIVLNEAACKLFADGALEEDELPDIDWLKASFSIRFGEDSRPIAARVCGIVKDEKEGQTPAAFVSLSAANELLRTGGQAPLPLTAAVRLTSTKDAPAVITEVEAAGFAASSDGTENEAVWKEQLKESSYLRLLGIVCLLSAAALLSVRQRAVHEQQSEEDLLRWMGMKRKTLRHLTMIETLTVSLFGALLGVLVSAALPLFLLPDFSGSACFKLPIPLWVQAADAAVCITLCSAIAASRKEA